MRATRREVFGAMLGLTAGPSALGASKVRPLGKRHRPPSHRALGWSRDAGGLRADCEAAHDAHGVRVHRWRCRRRTHPSRQPGGVRPHPVASRVCWSTSRRLTRRSRSSDSRSISDPAGADRVSPARPPRRRDCDSPRRGRGWRDAGDQLVCDDEHRRRLEGCEGAAVVSALRESRSRLHPRSRPAGRGGRVPRLVRHGGLANDGPSPS